MAKISTYVIDGTIVDGDKVIGSDANNSMQTKNYTIGDLVGYFAASIGNDYLVPYIGANDNVDLGTFNLSAGTLSISENFIANGTAGLPGQALLSQGPGSPAIWGYVVGSQDLASVLSIGNVGDLNINLINTNGYAKIDIQKLYGEPAMYLHSNTLGTYSNWEIDKLHLESTTNAADYTANKIRYVFGGNYVDIIPNSYNNQSFILPAVGGFVPVSVNGNFADASGNIIVPTGGVTGSGVATRVAFWGTSTSLSSNSLLYWDDNNERLGVGTSTPEVRLHVGDGGGAMGFPYEEAIVEKTGDTKFGVYTSVSDPGDGGASYTLGYTNFTTNLGFFPGFEYQLVGDANDADNYIRFNFLGRNSGGFVTYAYPNIFNLYADGRASFRTLIGTGTRMVTTDQYGFIGSQAIPTGGGGIPHATASGTDTYTATVTGVTSYADGDAYLIRFTNGNTTGATLNINGLGAIPLYRNNDGAVIGGDIIANGEMLCVYNSSLNVFQTIGTAPNTLLGYVTNDDSVTITKGQVVYAFGGQGDRMTVKLANNTSDATSARTVGVVLSTSIAANQKGLIMMQGLLDGLSILPTAIWNDGDPVYLGATAGSITNVKPYAPNHLVYVGTVTTASNGSAGRMYVNIQNGYELDELHNVQAQSPTYKDTLWYDNTVSPAQWKTASISTILGYTPFQLPSLTAGSVLFSNGTTIAQDNANFFWDDANNRLGIGTSTPSFPLDINGTGRFTGLLGAQGDFYAGAAGSSQFDINTLSATLPNTLGFWRKFGNGNYTYLKEDEQGGAQHKWAFVRRDGFDQTRPFFQANSSILNINLGWEDANSNNYDGNTLLINPKINITNAGITGTKIRGTYYNPTITSLTNTTHIAYENTSGDIIFGNLAGVGSRMVTADASGKLGVQAIPTSYTFSTGLTNTANTITNNLSTGVAGGQSVVGGTAASNSLTLSSTSNATKGKILFGTSAYDENTNNLGIGNTSPGFPLTLGTSIGISLLNANNLNYIGFNPLSTNFGISAIFAANGSPTGFGYNFQFQKQGGANANSLLFIGGNGSAVNNSANKHVITTSSDGTATGQPLVMRVAPTSTNWGSVNDHFTIFPTGNVVIQSGSTSATDAGYKLDVNGTARALTYLHSQQIIGYINAAPTATFTYKNTNAGGNNTPQAAFGDFRAGISGLNTFAFRNAEGLVFNTTNTSATPISRAAISITNQVNTAGSESGDLIFSTQSGGTAISEKMRITGAGGLTINATNTAAGTTGNQTINKASGTVNIAAAGTTVTVTNSLVTASSIVFAVIRTNDATATIKNVVPASGSFTINLNAATTAETSIGFFVIN